MQRVSQEIVAQVDLQDQLKFEEIDITQDDNCEALCDFLNKNYS